MAANNYFGFTHTGTQYTAAPGAAAAAAAYQAQGGYAVAPTGASTPAATYTAQRAATGYDYSAGTTAYAAPTAASATTYDYSGYARTAAQQAYDTSKTYYQQPVATSNYSNTPDYTDWTQASSAQKASPAVSAVYTAYTQRAPQPIQKQASVGLASVGLGATQSAYSGQSYAAPAAAPANTYPAAPSSSYSAVQNQNKFAAGGGGAGGIKKPAGAYGGTQAASTGIGYSTGTGYGTAAANTAYSGYTTQNKIGVSTLPTSAAQKPGLGTTMRTNVGGSTNSSNYSSSYDQALYNAALYQTTAGANSGGQNKPQWKNYNKTGTGTAGATNTFNKFQRPKQPPKPQQIHYCEVCKISCAGPLTYKEHLEGSRHKKKEQAQKAVEGEASKTGAKPSGGPRGAVFKCDLCSVTCTGTDAYTAHLRGVKHQKVVKLHQKLGKPIPEPDPKAAAILRAKAEALEAAKAAQANSGTGEAKVSAAPKINFVSTGSLNSTGKAAAESAAPSEKSSEDIDMVLEDNILPVGEEYVEEIKTEDGKLQTFHCKLCDCKFNDPNAKDMHMKGKRHRLAYKKKVDPSLVVEIKPNYFQKKQKEQRERLRADYARRREEERVNFWADKLMEHEERRYWEEMRYWEETQSMYYEWGPRRMMRPPGPPGPVGPRAMPPPPPPMMRGPMPPRAETYDDRHVMAKHDTIIPSKPELALLDCSVDSVEKALKNVSDLLVDALIAAEGEKGGKKSEKDGESPAEDKKKDNLKSLREKEEKRVLKGVNRVSALAKSILLPGEMTADLIILCAEKPTRSLLNQIIKHLPEQLKLVSPSETFKVVSRPEEAGFVVTRLKKVKAEPGSEEPAAFDAEVTINVVLTSPVIREQLLEKQAKDAADAKAKVEAETGAAKPAEAVVKKEPQDSVKPPPKDLLNEDKCLEALASLRHAKWFQAKAEPLQGCVITIRLLRHLASPWNLINQWALELLVEKVLASAQMPLSPGEALRRVLEAVSSGLLLASGPGLLDPCEKDPQDALAGMPHQDREDVTVAAQIGLRQMAFHQVHKFLGMDQLKIKRGFGGGPNRKRRRDTSSGEKEDASVKKDKKEEGGAETMETK